MRALAVLIGFASQLFAQTSPWAHEPRMSFEELRHFAQHTTIGGGSVALFEHDGRKVAIVMRCFTSGVRSSDFGVYAATSDGRYHRVLYREPIWGSFFHPTQHEDLISVALEPQSSQPITVAFSFTISSCYDPQDK